MNEGAEGGSTLAAGGGGSGGCGFEGETLGGREELLLEATIFPLLSPSKWGSVHVCEPHTHTIRGPIRR